MVVTQKGFWVFVATPRSYPIDRFLRERLPKRKGIGVWTVNKNSDFQRGDVGLVRVGWDSRTKKLLADDGVATKLKSGIYAVCEVLDGPSPAIIDEDADLWRSRESTNRASDMPKVLIKYLWSSLAAPLLLDEIKIKIPHLRSPTQGQYCFSIPKEDFKAIVDLLPASVHAALHTTNR